MVLRGHGMGLIIRNENGLVMAAAAIYRRGSCTVAEAEAKAILEGVLFAYEQGFFDLVVESDSAIVIQMIKNGEADQIFSGVGLLIADILDLVPQFRKIDFGYVKRTCNGPAHDLAKHGLASRIDKLWMEETPQCISLDVITSVSSS